MTVKHTASLTGCLAPLACVSCISSVAVPAPQLRIPGAGAETPFVVATAETLVVLFVALFVRATTCTSSTRITHAPHVGKGGGGRGTA